MENEGSTLQRNKILRQGLCVIFAVSFWIRGVFKWENQMIGPNFIRSLTRINHSFLMELGEWSWIYKGKEWNQISLWPQKLCIFSLCNHKDWQRAIIFKIQREQFLIKKAVLNTTGKIASLFPFFCSYGYCVAICSFCQIEMRPAWFTWRFDILLCNTVNTTFSI